MKQVSAKTIIRLMAMLVGVVAGILGVMVVLRSVVSICFPGLIPSREEKKYVVLRLSAESNIKEDEENYVFRQGNQIILYSFETGETTEYHLETTEAAGRSGFIVGTRMYSVVSGGTIRRFDLEKRTDEELLSKEDIYSMCGHTYLPDELEVSIGQIKQNLLLTFDGYDEDYYYICPVDGELKTDCVEVNTLFLQEERTGREQVILYRGMRIRRYYDAEKEGYSIIELGEKGGRPKVFDSVRRDIETIRVGVKLVSLGYQRDDRSYCVEGDSEEHNIGCLNSSVFDFSVIKPNNIVAENGKIIGLVQVIKNFRYDSWNPSQDELRYDVLFWLDPKTGKNGILYSPWNNRTRIIGYQDGVIYLLKNFKIYSRTVENKEEKLLVELPKDTYYEFDWQGDYLIVIRQNSIFGAYKVR